MKELKEKLIKKIKVISQSRHDDLKEKRSKVMEEIKKYKKIIAEERYRVIEQEAKDLFEKKVSEIEKMEKEK